PRGCPFHERIVALTQAAPGVDDQEPPTQALTRGEGINERLPGAALFLWAGRVAVPGEIHDALHWRQLEEIQQARTAGGFTGAGQTLPLDNSIDGRRLAGIGAPYKGDLRSEVDRKLSRRCRADEKFGSWKATHGP